ncbi:MAG TPA: DUF502 domain-containing protein [Phycisphaerae bacterium]|nr:DUF502 domain-containing protein [Phycisphaerae bacterium]
MKRLLQLMAQGLALVLPLLVTVSILIWLGQMAEGLLGGLLEDLLGTSPDAREPEVGWLGIESVYYVPGMGIAAGLVLALAIGIVARWWLIRQLVSWLEGWFQRIPLVKTLYGGIKDMLGMFGGKKQSFSRVVLVRLPGSELDALAMVTREEVTGFAQDADGRKRVAVYVPMSYMIGGLTFVVPADQVRPVAMGVEEAMRFAMTAGISAGAEPSQDGPATADAAATEGGPTSSSSGVMGG